MADELTGLRQQLAEYQAREHETRERAQRAAVDQAVASAVAGAGVQLRPGVEVQVTQLLRGDVVEASAGGQTVLAGPGLKPLTDHVKARLSSDEFAHFRVDGAPSPVRPGQQLPGDGRPVTMQGVMSQALNAAFGPAQPALGLVPAGQGLGSQIMANAAAARAAAPDARMDMSRPMGLRGK